MRLSLSKEWIVVGAVVGALGLGAAALTQLGSSMQRVDVAAPAPDFHAVDLATGDSVSLRERYAGQVTLVNIWATWCIPCRVEMPAMEQIYSALSPQGFRVAAVSIDEGKPDDVTAFARELDLSFDILHDRSGRIQQTYQTTGVPESFLVNRDGYIVKRVIGAYDWNSPANRALIGRLLAEPVHSR
jgi:cytochrome c biogenesis protein CcmG/thiol:disulfide interchange protein DsbE